MSSSKEEIKPTVPEPPPVTKGEPVFPHVERLLKDCLVDYEYKPVMDYIAQRREYGMRKYGQELYTKDGRSDVEDLNQELADAIQYMTKCLVNGTVVNKTTGVLCSALTAIMKRYNDEILYK